MRSTLAIDDDVFLHARRFAHEKRISIGAAVSALLREGVHATSIRRCLPQPARHPMACCRREARSSPPGMCAG